MKLVVDVHQDLIKALDRHTGSAMFRTRSELVRHLLFKGVYELSPKRAIYPPPPPLVSTQNVPKSSTFPPPADDPEWTMPDEE